MGTDNSLNSVVHLNECAKTVRRYAFQVSLSALGAIVLSSRTGSELKGFNEVALQMRSWSRDLEEAARAVTALSARRVHMVSDLLKRERFRELLRCAANGPRAQALLARCLERQAEIADDLTAQLRKADETIAESLDALFQLGLMASVLSRAALIEAAGGNTHQRRELTLASQEFASYADRVNDTVTKVRAGSRGL